MATLCAVCGILSKTLNSYKSKHQGTLKKHIHYIHRVLHAYALLVSIYHRHIHKNIMALGKEISSKTDTLK